MKWILLVVATKIFVLQSWGQVIGRFYYNDHWELTHQNSSAYFRVCVFDTLNYEFAGEIRDFTKQGKLLMSGPYKEGKRNGLFTFYYPNGQTESQGHFLNNRASGTWKYYYPDGSPKQEVTFLDFDFVIHYFYDSAGNKMVDEGTGSWYNIFEEYRLPNKVIVRGNFKNGKKDGEWECLLDNGAYLYEEKFKNGEFKSGYITNPKGNRQKEYYSQVFNKLLPHYRFDIIEKFEREPTVSWKDYPYLRFLRPPTPSISDTTAEGETFLVVEQSATPKGGMSAFYKHVAENLKYPFEARRNGIEGKVFVEFVINQDGSLSDVKVVKGIGGGCDEEAVRVVKKAPPWNPGQQKGRPVRQRYVVPITFRLG